MPQRSWFRRYGLNIIFVVAYCFMALLVIEQGRTITAQQQLIRMLFRDSVELNSLRAHHPMRRN